MTTEQKIEFNKIIRLYDGKNTFIISLQKHLRSNKYLTKIEVGNKKLKILSDRQYEAFDNIYKQEKVI